MSGPTLISSLEVEQYAQAVREALADLPAAEREELLEDLPDHLAEVAAEDEGTLRERLGDPQTYAAELRTAAGLDPRPGQDTLRATLAQSYRHGRELLVGLDAGLGRAMGYPRASDLGRALRPGWWVLRGWIVAQLLCDAGQSYHWHGLVPDAGTSQTGGAVITIAAILASLWLGRRTDHASAWPRGIATATSLALAIWALTVLTGYLGSSVAATSYAVVPAGSAAPTPLAPTSPPAASNAPTIAEPTVPMPTAKAH